MKPECAGGTNSRSVKDTLWATGSRRGLWREVADRRIQVARMLDICAGLFACIALNDHDDRHGHLRMPGCDIPFDVELQSLFVVLMDDM